VGREAPVTLQRTPGAPMEIRYLDMVFQALTEADGTRSGVIVHGSDITAQVLARREVEHLLGESEGARAEAEAARREAEAANRGKSEFLAVMSHELRTPLNAIGGYAELIELGIRGPVSDEQRLDLARIQQSQRHLLGLINGVLNYARVEAGAVIYDVEDVQFGEVLSACEALIAPQVRARGLTLQYTPADGLRARADSDKVQQIVLNLLSNAVKFTEPGGRVSLRCRAANDDGAPVVRVEVNDTGIGISREQLARVFEPFVQVDAKLTRTREGTGLGLAISRDLARGMGGDLVAESTLGVGSTFTLVLPAS
jgi:signal transduction histidine kinase